MEALAQRAAIVPGMAVLDVCAGLGGPARFLAYRFGARVTGVDLTHSRCAAGARLTALVRLGPLVRHVRGDAQMLPFRSRAFDAAVSQEGLLHVPDKAAVLGECARVLKPGPGSPSATGSRGRASRTTSAGGSSSGWPR